MFHARKATLVRLLPRAQFTQREAKTIDAPVKERAHCSIIAELRPIMQTIAG